MTKQFLSWLDIGISAPQPEQHLIIKNFANKHNGNITFSDSEDIVNRFNQNFLLSRLIELPDIDGVVLFTIKQFYLNKKFNFKLLNKIINNNFEVLFAREQFCFTPVNISIMQNELIFLNYLSKVE
tara:strand:+ start:461 stop:838 length:378 start_codon:yes stop_codon:yes gene_type:complete